MSSTARRIRKVLCRTGGSGARKLRASAFVLMFAVGLLVTMPASPVAAARGATAYDFNGDGRADLAVGIPGRLWEALLGPETRSVPRTRPVTSMETDTPIWPSAFPVEALGAVAVL